MTSNKFFNLVADVIASSSDESVGDSLHLPFYDELRIRQFVEAQEDYQFFTHEVFHTLKPYPFDGVFQTRVQHLIHLNKLTAQLTWESISTFPEFRHIAPEDQEVLRQKATSEVMILRAARKYHRRTDSVVLANNRPYTKMQLMDLMGFVTDQFFDFCKQMNNFNVNDAEYALLSAIVVFSERPGLRRPLEILRYQNSYIEHLKKYVVYKRPGRRNYFDTLMAIPEELADIAKKIANNDITWGSP